MPAIRNLLLLTPAVLASCAPLGTGNAPQRTQLPAPPKKRTTPAPPPEPSHSAAAPRFRKTTLSSIPIQFVSFDSRTHRLVLADQPGGPGSRWPDSRAAGQSLSGLAAVNGGFFTPEGSPLGLVVADGTRRGSWNRSSSLGSGCYLDAPPAWPKIARRENVSPSDPATRTLLQSGPMLVDAGRAVGGLRSDNRRPRSFLAWDGKRRWLLGITSSCSLADLAKALAGSSPAGWPVRSALNLDGGRSTELWASPAVSGGPAFERPFFNKPVRNFLVLKGRKSP
jgi:hypothetical protein